MARKIIKTKFELYEEKVETMAEIPAEDQEPLESNDKLKIIGKRISRIDGYDKVSGSAEYTFDKILPNMAFAKTLRCPFPHARIKNINIKKAKAIPGVLEIITHKNTKEIPWYYGSSLLFDNQVRYQGDEVACVAAETEKISEEAIKLIEVEYEELPFVVNSKEAMKDGAVKVHDNGNVPEWADRKYSRGNAEDGFNAADEIIENTFSTQVAVHNPMEPHCSVVNWDGGKLTVWDSTQGIFSVRDFVAQSLDIPASKVRVIKKFMGGGFGSKLEAGKYTVMAALLARKIGRPVKISLDRKEMNLSVGNRPGSVQKLKLGTKKDGTLTAMSHDSYGPMGAYPSGAGCAWPLRSLYKCANIDIKESSVYINAGRARPFRAPGHVQGTFALESIIDDLAEKIGMDPIQFRIVNHTEVDQDSNNPYTSKKLLDAYRKGAEAIGWYSRRKPKNSDNGPIKKGIGMASQIWWGGGVPPAYATLKLNRDGSVRVLAGTQDIGGGTYTILAQVAAEVLEIPIEKVNVSLGDTANHPYCNVSGGSLTAPSVTPAVYDAAVQMKNKLISGASAILEVPEDRLIYSDGIIKDKTDESNNTKISDVVRGMREQVLVTTGARNANPDGYAINTFGAQFAEVEVDTDTGKVKVLKIVAAHDIGRILNQTTMENQFHGGIMQGLSFALFEERIIDDYTGKVLTTNLHDYKVPTIMDVPEIEIIIVSDPDPLISPVGVKGIGEPAIIPTPGAIANAVYNAIGIRIKSLPITPDKVLMALQS